MIVDDGRGELRRGVSGSADQVHDEAVDEGLQPDRLALGIQVGGELALADGGLEYEEIAAGAKLQQWLPLLAERFAKDRLRALVRLEAGTDVATPAVLFLCVHNAGRWQMAAGWLRSLAGDRVNVFSGGSEPADDVNQGAVAAMAEVGIDISAELPQPWADEIVRAADVVVTMGCGDACPLHPGKRYLDWELADPAGKPIEEIRPIRDEIGQAGAEAHD